MSTASRKIGASLFIVSVLLACKTSQPVADVMTMEGQKDVESGLFLDESMMLVKGQCTGCHSAKLISMNRFTREGWKEKITWMQETQNLWNLGESEPAILDYLAKYYAPENKASRRENLEKIEWYPLKQP
ncbi:MAG: hypothetical protein ACI9IP_000428 [Arcticibacterium sp.]|jgi:hypothetical protein